MAQKVKCFYIHTRPDPSRRVRRGECVPLSMIGFSCPLCKSGWKVSLIQAGKRAMCETCRIEALEVKVSYSDKTVRAANHRNKKGHINAA